MVYRGMDMRTGTHVAIKQLSLDRIPQDSLQVNGDLQGWREGVDCSGNAWVPANPGLSWENLEVAALCAAGQHKLSRVRAQDFG